jgi:hypothetical protein
MNKIVLVVSFIFLFCSCQFFEKSVPTEDELLEQRLKEINWKEVTEYPSIAHCDSILDKEQKKQCFFENLTFLIQEKLNDHSEVLHPKITDTIQVKVTVYPDSRITFEPQTSAEDLPYSKEIIDSLLQARLIDLPKIEPAQKEGIPVKTEFILPVLLHSDK